MLSGGSQSRSTPQLSSIQALQDWVDDAVANLSLTDRSQAVTVLDLGSAQLRGAGLGDRATLEELSRRFVEWRTGRDAFTRGSVG